MDSTELNSPELNDSELEHVSGGLTLGCKYWCTACHERFTYEGRIADSGGDVCPYCGATADKLKMMRG